MIFGNEFAIVFFCLINYFVVVCVGQNRHERRQGNYGNASSKKPKNNKNELIKERKNQSLVVVAVSFLIVWNLPPSCTALQCTAL